MLKRLSSLLLIFCFLVNTIGLRPAYAQGAADLPVPGTMVSLSPAYTPVLMKGLRVHPENPFKFDFIMDTGHSKLAANDPALKAESNRLIKYFLTALTVPEKELWVNLSPYEKDRLTSQNLGQTQMASDLLAQDYMLKQLTASLIYPEKELGKAFWDKVYAKAQQLYGTTQVPVNAFNKVWIVAQRADIFERNNTAYVSGAHLKVMLEEDYLAKEKNEMPTRGHVQSELTMNVSPSTKAPQGTNQTPNVASSIIREIILPEIEREVNEGKNFAPLRQMFYSMILASWYKMALKDALLTQVYGNQSKLGGLSYKKSVILTEGKDLNKLKDSSAMPQNDVEAIYQRYLEAYKKGVFNYIKEEPSTVILSEAKDLNVTKTAPRKYFSGGFDYAMLGPGPATVLKRTTSIPIPGLLKPTGSLAMVSGDAAPVSKAMTSKPVVTQADIEVVGKILNTIKREGYSEFDLSYAIDHPQNTGQYQSYLFRMLYRLVMKRISQQQFTNPDSMDIATETFVSLLPKAYDLFLDGYDFEIKRDKRSDPIEVVRGQPLLAGEIFSIKSALLLMSNEPYINELLNSRDVRMLRQAEIMKNIRATVWVGRGKFTEQVKEQFREYYRHNIEMLKSFIQRMALYDEYEDLSGKGLEDLLSLGFERFEDMFVVMPQEEAVVVQVAQALALEAKGQDFLIEYTPPSGIEFIGNGFRLGEGEKVQIVDTQDRAMASSVPNVTSAEQFKAMKKDISKGKYSIDELREVISVLGGYERTLAVDTPMRREVQDLKVAVQRRVAIAVGDRNHFSLRVPKGVKRKSQAMLSSLDLELIGNLKLNPSAIEALKSIAVQLQIPHQQILRVTQALIGQTVDATHLLNVFSTGNHEITAGFKDKEAEKFLYAASSKGKNPAKAGHIKLYVPQADIGFNVTASVWLNRMDYLIRKFGVSDREKFKIFFQGENIQLHHMGVFTEPLYVREGSLRLDLKNFLNTAKAIVYQGNKQVVVAVGQDVRMKGQKEIFVNGGSLGFLPETAQVGVTVSEVIIYEAGNESIFKFFDLTGEKIQVFSWTLEYTSKVDYKLKARQALDRYISALEKNNFFDSRKAAAEYVLLALKYEKLTFIQVMDALSKATDFIKTSPEDKQREIRINNLLYQTLKLENLGGNNYFKIPAVRNYVVKFYGAGGSLSFDDLVGGLSSDPEAMFDNTFLQKMIVGAGLDLQFSQGILYHNTKDLDAVLEDGQFKRMPLTRVGQNYGAGDFVEEILNPALILVSALKFNDLRDKKQAILEHAHFDPHPSINEGLKFDDVIKIVVSEDTWNEYQDFLISSPNSNKALRIKRLIKAGKLDFMKGFKHRSNAEQGYSPTARKAVLDYMISHDLLKDIPFLEIRPYQNRDQEDGAIVKDKEGNQYIFSKVIIKGAPGSVVRNTSVIATNGMQFSFDWLDSQSAHMKQIQLGGNTIELDAQGRIKRFSQKGVGANIYEYNQEGVPLRIRDEQTGKIEVYLDGQGNLVYASQARLSDKAMSAPVEALLRLLREAVEAWREALGQKELVKVMLFIAAVAADDSSILKKSTDVVYQKKLIDNKERYFVQFIQRLKEEQDAVDIFFNDLLPPLKKEYERVRRALISVVEAGNLLAGAFPSGAVEILLPHHVQTSIQAIQLRNASRIVLRDSYEMPLKRFKETMAEVLTLGLKEFKGGKIDIQDLLHKTTLMRYMQLANAQVGAFDHGVSPFDMRPVVIMRMMNVFNDAIKEGKREPGDYYFLGRETLTILEGMLNKSKAGEIKFGDLVRKLSLRFKQEIDQKDLRLACAATIRMMQAYSDLTITIEHNAAMTARLSDKAMMVTLFNGFKVDRDLYYRVVNLMQRGQTDDEQDKNFYNKIKFNLLKMALGQTKDLYADILDPELSSSTYAFLFEKPLKYEQRQLTYQFYPQVREIILQVLHEMPNGDVDVYDYVGEKEASWVAAAVFASTAAAVGGKWLLQNQAMITFQAAARVEHVFKRFGEDGAWKLLLFSMGRCDVESPSGEHIIINIQLPDGRSLAAVADRIISLIAGVGMDRMPQIIRDSFPVPARVVPGGIDLDKNKMQMKVSRQEGQGNAPAMNIDPVSVERFKKGDFAGIEFHIKTITPLTNLPQFLSLRPDESPYA